MAHLSGETKPFWAQILAPLRAVAGPLVATAVAAGVIAAILTRPSGPAAAPGRGDAPTGRLLVQVPQGTHVVQLRFTLLRLGEPAASADGRTMDGVWPETISAAEFPAGVYVVRTSYRGERLPDRSVNLRSGYPVAIRPDASRLAEIEYRTGLAQAAAGGKADLPYFQRALELDPGHVEAHLQLAAAALLQGSTRRAAEHVAAVRKVQPFNPHAARLAELIRKWKNKRR